MKLIIPFVILVFVLILTSCMQNKKPFLMDDESNGRVFCTEQRPEICTQIYDPVCGDNNQTYSNSCVACSDPLVTSSVTGECG